jgi:hypothetical protein
MHTTAYLAWLLLSCETITSPSPSKAKFFEAAVSLAQNLTQWALLIIGGSLVTVVGTSYYRPDSRRMRFIYLLFVPAWILLAVSIYEGTLIQRKYLAYLYANPSGVRYQILVDRILQDINNEATNQFLTLEWALVCLGLWLVAYLFWWIESEKREPWRDEYV